ncbi:hypothetical protein G6F57_022564 [Rhizopus arrhizus]|nr:hypothetical protein G6F57_022564 [Rhizopus arrhizus]
MPRRTHRPGPADERDNGTRPPSGQPPDRTRRAGQRQSDRALYGPAHLRRPVPAGAFRLERRDRQARRRARGLAAARKRHVGATRGNVDSGDTRSPGHREDARRQWHGSSTPRACR